jgi:soluble lytic murein transglycosylase-like protein
MQWLAGDAAAAEAVLREGGDARSRFWLGVMLRRRGSAEGDSILRAEFAERTGHDFYSVAARETLGVRGWRGRIAPPPGPVEQPRLADAVDRLAGSLALPREAARLVSAWDRMDPRLVPNSRARIMPSTWCSIAASLYQAGDLAGATRAADRSQGWLGPDVSPGDWAAWKYPPAFERELTGAANRFGIDRALLWALARQESAFDPRAVSRKNALGLTQLLPGTARDMSRELKEKLPSDSLMFEPDRSLRYGAHHLKKMLKRYGVVPVALTAYHAGPASVRADWRALVERGGWALYCDMVSDVDTQTYVRNVLAFRQAYREFEPMSAGANP